MDPVSVEAFDMFSPGEISESNSCGVNSDCESGMWLSALVSHDIRVSPSFAVEVVGEGEPSDSGWEFGSERGSVAVSGVPVETDVGETAPYGVTEMCGGAPSDSESDFVEPQSLSFSKMRNFVYVEDKEDMNYEETQVKAPPCPKRRMMTPLPQQSPFSSMEEGSPWSAQERTAIARMEQYVINSECINLEVAEVEGYSLGPEYSDVDVKHITRNATREGRHKLEVFSVKEKGEHPVASKLR